MGTMAIVNVNLQYRLPRECMAEHEILAFLHDVKLPDEYVEGSFEFIKAVNDGVE